ncbi:MAG: transposase [Thermoplasmatales archaeon]|nr:MAG: transposase [Thermoplasmatales archaeon]
MRASKRNISKKNIELEIYKTFEQVKEKKNISIADFLNKLELDFDDVSYRRIKFSYKSLFKLILYQNLKGIKFHTKLTKHLRKNVSDRFKLGFTKTPDRRTIGFFLHHILDKEAKELLQFATDKIEEISEKFNILLDVKILQPEKPKKTTKIRNQDLQKKEKTREVCRLIKKRFSPFIDLNLKNNTLYKKNQFIDLLIHMGMTRDFAENGNKTFRELRQCGCPDADTLLYHLKNYPNRKQVHKMFITLFEIVWEMARKSNIFDIRKRYDVAVDFTEWYFYGDRSTPMVVGKEPDRGTTKCYKFATINIVEAGKRFTLLALPVGPFDEKENLLRKIISYAQDRIKIRRVYVDRGFFDSKAIKLFNSFHLKYLMPATKIPTVKDVMEIAAVPSVIIDFEMKDITFNLVIVEEELERGQKVKRAFATNEEYDENDVNLAERLFNLYGKRWGVETSYKVKKHSYLPKTTSKKYLIRLFYFMFSVLLYNLWILADILIWLALFGFIKTDHLVTSKLFGTILYTVDPDSGG